MRGAHPNLPFKELQHDLDCAGCSERLPVPGGVREPLLSSPLLVRALLCFGGACLRSGLLGLGLLGRHVTLRGRLVLLGLAFLLQRLVPAYGPAASLARPFTSSTTPSTPASGPDSFVKVVSRCSRVAVLSPRLHTTSYPVI